MASFSTFKTLEDALLHFKIVEIKKANYLLGQLANLS